MQKLNSTTHCKRTYTERIIQFGEGNFLRAFVDWIVQGMNDRAAFDGSVVIVQPIAQGMVGKLSEQDCMYHVNLQGLIDGQAVNSLTLIDSVSRAMNPYDDFDEYLRLAEVPTIRFVISNTTEAGIAFDDTCKLHDRPASSYPGKLVQLLWHRFCTFGGDSSKGLIIMPCELIFLNGHHLRECIDRYVELWRDDFGSRYEAFRQWVATCCHVCATLVDRIVPGFPRREIAEIQERLGYEDNMVVQGEAFHLWVIETAPGLPIEQLEREFPATKAGLNVVFTHNEAPYHERKVTLLNGPHTVLAPVAFLSGINIVRDACKHPVVGRFVDRVMNHELMSTLNLPEAELRQFAADVMERFLNPFVDHQVTSIMLNSFPKFQTRDLPGLKTYLERRGELPKGIVLGLAAITTYYRGGTRSDGVAISPNDDQRILDLLTRLWQTGDMRKIAEGVLGADELIWHEHGNLNDIPGLTDMLTSMLEKIQRQGMLATVEELLEE